MRRFLLIAISALLLTGCIAEWKNPKGPQRWSGSPYIATYPSGGGDMGGQGNHAMGPGPGNF